MSVTSIMPPIHPGEVLMAEYLELLGVTHEQMIGNYPLTVSR